ncbi:PE family protein [Mycobacterium sp. 050134]|uniref:PE family protein n=1 Tax=Mycobacterium sp. 050134 TaxID=3096111 RepID=UPI002ED9C7C7
MSTLIAQPQLLTSAAADASAIGSAIDEARAAAAGSTTNLVAAAQDEVSAITAEFFGAFGQEYQTLLQQATAFHSQFVATLGSAGTAYTQAENEIADMLGLNYTAPTFGKALQAADPAVAVNLIMTGSGTATPSTTYLNNVFSRYLSASNPFGPFLNGPLQALSTPEGLYPFTGVKDLTLDISLARGVTELNNAIRAIIVDPATYAGNPVSVLGYSQSAILASLEMPNLAAAGVQPSQMFFTLLGDPANPNGGLLARFPGLSFPSLGVTFGTSTPSNLYPTSIYTLEYDGFADFPRYPIDIFADLNALAGIVFVHGTYPTLDPAHIAQAFLLPGSAALDPANGMTNYYMIPTENLPLLTPLRAIPFLGNPLADLIQPDLKALVNWGYGDPNYGFSTSPANVQTPFGFLPPMSATAQLGPLLVSGTQQGITAFANDISAMVPTSLPNLSSLTSLIPGAGATGGAVLAAPAIPSFNDVISGIQTANTTFTNTLTADFSTAYATLLPTADIGTAIAVTLPSYDFNLFLDGISEAVNGNVIQGLVDAFGRPIAANIGLTTLAGGFELINLVNAAETIFTGVPHPGPQ